MPGAVLTQTIDADRPEKMGWPLKLFVVSLFLPWVVQVGPLAFSTYRLTLLITIVPSLFMLVSGRAGRIRFPDLAILGFCLWSTISLLALYGAGSVAEPAGILFVETAGAYLLARCYIRSAAVFRQTMTLFVYCFVVLLPFLIIEAVTRQNLLLITLSKVMPTIWDASDEARMGFRRAQGVFDHPILLGVNAGCAFAMAYLVVGHGIPAWKRLALTGAVLACALTALSSGPLGAIALQIVLIGWERLMRPVSSRWLILALGLAAVYLLVAVGLQRPPVELYIRYFSFDQYNAWYRLLIWEYGSASVMAHPWFGVGFGAWVHPSWMTSSVDHFWLGIAMRSGLPAIGLLLLAYVGSAALVAMRPGLDETTHRYRLAYLFVLAGLFMVGCTVFYWGSSYVLCLFLLGSGLWILDATPLQAKAEQEVPVAARRTRMAYTRPATHRPVRAR